VKHRDEEQILIEGCRNLGYPLPPESVSKFRTYLDLLLSWNRRVNLFSKRDESRLVSQHILPSLAPLIVLPQGPLRVVDIGSGAGFPGIPLKIVRPELVLALVESKRKRALFLRKVVEELALKEVQVIWARAEEVATDTAHRDIYDWALARAVADLPTLLGYAFPLLREEGGLIAYKTSERARRELRGWDLRWEVHEVVVHPSLVSVTLIVIKATGELQKFVV